jgi:hypothetical protein
MSESDGAANSTSSSQSTYVLFESASGYSIFEVASYDEISQASEKVQEAVR